MNDVKPDGEPVYHYPGSFPVLDNHPAMSARYCELCGGEVDAMGECTGHADSLAEERQELARIMSVMCRWALERPKHMLVLAAKVEHPARSIRDVARIVGLGHSQTHAIAAEIAETIPGLDRLCGMTSPAAIGQQRRRRIETQKGVKAKDAKR